MEQTQTPFRYSNEELRVLEQCNRESFYQRCLPLSTVFGLGTYFAIKSGKLNPSPKYGVGPKVFGAVVCGYLMGKVSYQHKCAEKLMALPDSKLGALLRSRQNPRKNALTIDIPESDSLIKGISEEEKYDDVKKTHMDIDMDRPVQSEFEDYFRPNLDGAQEPSSAKDGTSSLPSTSYDELRRKNRDEYEKNRTKAYRGVLIPDDIPTVLKTYDEQTKEETSPERWSTPTSPSPTPPRRPPPTNIYGDVWEK